MRKILVLSLMLVFALALLAETPKEEAIKSLDNAKALLGKDDFVKAQAEIDYAVSKISEVLAEQLLKYIPDAPAGFKLEDKEATAMGQAGAIIGSTNGITAKGTYSKGDASIDLTIMIGGIMGKTAGLAGLASMFGGVNLGGGSKTVRIKGYSGNQEYDKDNESGTLSIQVGEKITVMLDGNNIENTDILKTIAEAVDLAKLETSF